MAFKLFIYDNQDTTFSNPVDISKYVIGADIKLGYLSTANLVNVTLRNLHNKIVFDGINLKERPLIRIYLKKGFVNTSTDLPEATGTIVTTMPSRDNRKTNIKLKINDDSFLFLNKVINLKKQGVSLTAPNHIKKAINQVATHVVGDGTYTILDTGVVNTRSDGSAFPTVNIGASNMRLSKFIEMVSTPQYTGDNVNYIYWLELKIDGNDFKVNFNWTYPTDVENDVINWYDDDLLSDSPSDDKSTMIFTIINLIGTDLYGNSITSRTKNENAPLSAKIVSKNYSDKCNIYYEKIINDGIIIPDDAGNINWANKRFSVASGYDKATENTKMINTLKKQADALNAFIFTNGDFSLSISYKGVKTIVQGGLYQCNFPALNINEKLRCIDKQLIYRPSGITSNFKFKPDPKAGGPIESF